MVIDKGVIPALARNLGAGGIALAWVLSAGAALAADPANTNPVDSGAKLEIGYSATASSLDPQRQKNSGEPTYTSLLYDRLTTVTNDFGVQPMLAESWSFKNGGAVLEMKLRHDVKFHD